MDKQINFTIRDIAWDVLIETNTTELPVKITPLANLYQFSGINYSKTRYENSLNISKEILKFYGIKDTEECMLSLTRRLLAPLCVLKKCKMYEPKEISKACDIPIDIAVQRANRLQKLLNANTFYYSELEQKVFNNFKNFIYTYNSNL